MSGCDSRREVYVCELLAQRVAQRDFQDSRAAIAYSCSAARATIGEEAHDRLGARFASLSTRLVDAVGERMPRSITRDAAAR